jgi:P4 family phage/plasmid primase-like protien
LSPFRSQPSKGDTEELPDRDVIAAQHELHAGSNQDRLGWWKRSRGVSEEALKAYRVGWDAKRKRYTLPVFDAANRLVNVKWYRTDAKPKMQQMDGWAVGTRLFGLHRTEVASGPAETGIGRYILFTAGEPDALRAATEGFVALSGTNGEKSLVRLEDIDALELAGWSSARVIYDNDKDGRAGADKLARALIEAGWESVRVIVLRCPAFLAEACEDEVCAADEGDCGTWGKDLTDWFNAGGSLSMLRDLFGTHKDLKRFRIVGDDESSSAPFDPASAEIPVNGKRPRRRRRAPGTGPRRPLEQILAITKSRYDREGGRNAAASFYGQQAATEGYTLAEIVAGVLGFQKLVERVPSKPGDVFSADEAQRAARSGAKRPLAERNGPRYSSNDIGNAERFLAQHGNDFRVLLRAGKENSYHVWNGICWTPNHSLAITWARETIDEMREEARARKAAGDTDGADKLLKWANQSGNIGKIKSMLEMAATYPGQELEEVFDDERSRRIALPNGTLWLGDDGAKLCPSARADGLTEALDVTWDPARAEREIRAATRWRALIASAQPDPEMQIWLQKLLGAALYGGNQEQLIALFIGKSGTGKSTILSTVQKVLGIYGRHFNLSLFKGKGSEIDVEKYEAVNARFIWNGETNANVRLHADVIKTLTGGDPLTARRPFDRGTLSRVPAFMPFVAGNVYPAMDGVDAALKRRLVVVRFDAPSVYEVGDQTNNLAELIHETEAEGVLAWLIRGWDLYRSAGGLSPYPRAVQAGVSEAMAESGPFGSWWADCVRVDAAGCFTAREALDSFKQWSFDGDVKEEYNVDSMGKAITGYWGPAVLKKIGRKPLRRYMGIKLI